MPAASRFSWADYGNLPLEAVVCLPLQQLSLEEVSSLAVGSVLRSAYHLTDELFLRVDGVDVANVTLEPAGATRGARITNFDARKPAVVARSHAADPPRPSAAPVFPQHLRHCRVSLSLGFASRPILLQDVLDLAPGQLLQMETLLHDPVSLLFGNRVIAYGTPILQAECYSILIAKLLQPPAAAA